jgi:hypothetical protein
MPHRPDAPARDETVDDKTDHNPTTMANDARVCLTNQDPSQMAMEAMTTIAR